MFQRNYQSKLKNEFDLLIIGGGINGTGIARDASERGLKVLLLEKDDFAYGCTSASTRLIHGGLRYLEHFEFDLVRESLKEREVLLNLANHLVKPIKICIPVYKGDKRPYWEIKAGMVLYDLLSYDKSLPAHQIMNKHDFVRYEGAVNDVDLLGAAVYSDAQVDFPERICIENMLMAKNAGAVVLNHAEVKSIKIDKRNISSIDFLDKLSNSTCSVKAKVIVNASGPWVDNLCSLTKLSLKKNIGGTKGSHIIVKKYPQGPKHAIYASSKADMRPFFIIPWQEYYLIGTTDIPFNGNLDKVQITNDEINYLLNESNRILKNKTLNHSDILFSYSGVRPLPFSSAGDQEPSKITRKHIILDHGNQGISNFISIIGGKLTTYRNLSEQVVNLVIKKLNYNFVQTKTKSLKFIGAYTGDYKTYTNSEVKKIKNKYDLEPDIIQHWYKSYNRRYKHR